MSTNRMSMCDWAVEISMNGQTKKSIW